MYKIILIILILLLIFLISCNVNETTGLITIYNNTNRTLKSVAAGETNIALILGSNKKTDYWFYKKLKGKITIIRDNDNYTFTTKENYDFEMNNYYIMTIMKHENGCYSIELN